MVKKERILIVDDDPDILDVLSLTLSEQYDVIQAHDGEEGLRYARTKSPGIVILDYKMPKLSGPQVCQELKKDILLQHIPVILLTGKSETTDKVTGINAGADDYIVKPFDPQELLARIRMILRRSQRDLDANPLTRLPGNVSIINELQMRLDSKQQFAVAYLDLDKFKSYNDKYGFEHGDEMIQETARIIIRAIKELGNGDDFIGHIGGDDFVFVTTPDRVDAVCQKIIQDFEAKAPTFYSEDERKRGYIAGTDRQGNIAKFPIVSVSIGVAANETRQFSHVAQINEICAELKEHAKKLERSNFIKDKRSNTRDKTKGAL
ncbi:MAG: GGDEF domain-containing response regulator [Candidatus Omnitrophota bacterium]